MPSNQRRVAMITGGNSGIGLVTAGKLAGQGFHVILAARNQQTAGPAIERIQAAIPGASVESIPLDLASFASIRQAAAAFQARGYPLHVLINNAGGSIPGKEPRFSADGFELTLATNHLGHFLLTNLLLEDVKAAAPARVITVSSQLHIPGYGGRGGRTSPTTTSRGRNTTTPGPSTATPSSPTCGLPMSCSAGWPAAG